MTSHRVTSHRIQVVALTKQQIFSLVELDELELVLLLEGALGGLVLVKRSMPNTHINPLALMSISY